MRAIIFQSDVRANDPVGGCYRIICELKRQIEYNMVELHFVLQQLALCRAPSVPHQPYLDAKMCDPMSYDPHLHRDEEEEEGYFLNEPSLEDVASWGKQDNAISSLHDCRQSFGNECHDLKPTSLDVCGKRFELKFDYAHEERIERFVSSPF